ncbi:hypothetical protein EAH_00053130 [Eimeria acervulina]|uniref:Uncharacterized protein n=1 Tax=Eimeria acervulina TaxID=5801 RepID=U6GY33_EIMAC|nr:hypothetical protein EAH_00053130 [Eimeria acervulina]CDI84502.1 hypothetical protein EAH_00053130 [Eimeria acervulina]
MLGGAKYFSTLDLDARFHQIRMPKADRGKTAFRSVLGLFEHKVMPFALKGAPATFQASINTYLQPLLGHGVIAYLDNAFIYSVELPSHVALLRKVLSIFLTNQFYPKFRKCQFAHQELTYLGYTIGAEGIKSASEKIEANRVWPEVLENETQVRQFLGTVNYCRMLMGPDFADISRPHVTLTRKATPFHWTAAHTQAVRHLKQRLIDYTTRQVPDTSKPFELYADASGYAIGGVLEQAGLPIGFLSQAMTPVQQKYSIYDQDLLALATALDKWSHVLRVGKVTACTDHQALTHLRKLQTSKPLRGRTARWLDFLVKFPYLTIIYLQDPAPHTRGKQANYPQLASIRRRPPRTRPHSPPVSLKANETPPDGTEPSAIPPVQPADSATLDWPAAYAKCPVFRVPYNTAVKAVDLWQQLCTRFNIKRALSSSYHPQSDGQTERVNRTLEQMLRTYIQSDEREWERLLPALELAYNITSHSSTELSSFEVIIGENPLAAADLDAVGAFSPTLTPPMTKLFRQLCDRAQSHILKAKGLQTHYADTHRREVEYALVPDCPRASELEPQEAVVGWPPTRDVAGNPTDRYEVGYIMDQRRSGDEFQYLVKWRGYPEDQATWEPASHLHGCPALLRAWRRRHRNRLPP